MQERRPFVGFAPGQHISVRPGVYYTSGTPLPETSIAVQRGGLGAAGASGSSYRQRYGAPKNPFAEAYAVVPGSDGFSRLAEGKSALKCEPPRICGLSRK
jgi:hypothetical protein